MGLFVAESICISAFVVEFSRALSGNTLSWAYVVEWPVLGAYAIYMWRKLLKDDGAPPTFPAAPIDEVEDSRLNAWNNYLAAVHRDDQSGQSPS